MYNKNRMIVFLFLCFSSLGARVFEVGPGYQYDNIGNVPLETLMPGDTVLIYARTEPYREKWVIGRSGTVDSPIIFLGVPDVNGNLPVIDGDSASTRQELDYWSEERAIINVGGSDYPSDTPRYIIIENLEFVHARPPYTFYDDSGNEQTYSSNAAAIDVIYGDHITIRNCIIHDCANGIFTCHAASDITIEGNYIYDNGMENSIYVHNSYTESKGIIFQFNYYGHLRAGCLGNNLKDRSAGTVIRYNWIEGGNRQLDLVESDYPELYDLPEYRKTYVYGNILYEDSDEGNSQIIHYGGDGGDTDTYRKGTLYLYNNTIISKRSGNTTLMNLSTNDEHCDMRNNIVYTTQNGSYLAMLDANGILVMKNNFIKAGWVNSHEGSNFNGAVIDSGMNIENNSPYFVDFLNEDFHLSDSSPCINAGAELNDACIPDYTVDYQYVKHCSYETRTVYGTIDIGAYEFVPTSIGEKDDLNKNIHALVYNRTLKLGRLKRGDVVEIFDINGRVIVKKEMVNNGVFVHVLPENTVYMIRIRTGNGLRLLKIIVF